MKDEEKNQERKTDRRIDGRGTEGRHEKGKDGGGRVQERWPEVWRQRK